MVGAVRHRPAGPGALVAAAQAVPGRGPARRRRRPLGPRPDRGDRTALLIGLALVVAVNSLGASFLKSISDEFDRSFARDLTVQPTGLAPGQGPQQTIARSVERRLAKLDPEAAVVARERFVFTSEPAGPEGEDEFGRPPGRLRAAATIARSTRPTSRARRLPRGGLRRSRARRGHRRQGLRRRGEARGGGHARARRALGERARARIAGIVETVLFGGQTVGMSLEHDARTSTASPATRSWR